MSKSKEKQEVTEKLDSKALKYHASPVKNKPEQMEKHIQSTIIESQESSVGSLEKLARHENQPDQRSSIKISIETGLGRNIPINQENTIRTNSQLRDYSLDEGAGIFEKKTIVANSSIEEAKDDEISQHTLVPFHGVKSKSKDEIGAFEPYKDSTAADHSVLLKKYENVHHGRI